MLAKLGQNVSDGPALLFGVIGARALVADPETVNAHLQNFLDGVLADRLDAGEGEDGKLLSAFDHALAKFHRPLFVQQKIFVENEKDQVGVQFQVAFRDGVNIPAVRQQLDVFAREEMGRAAKIAAVGTAQPREDFSRAGGFPPKHLEPAYHQRMLVRHRDFRLAQQPPEIRDALLPADEVRVRFEHVVFQHRAVTTENDLALRRIFADQRDRLLHLVHDHHDEGNADVLVTLLEFADQLPFRRVLQHHRGRVKVFGDIIEAKMDVDRARAKEALGAHHLPVKQFVTDGRRIAVFRPHWATYTG